MNILYAQSPALFWCALALIVCFFVRRGAHRVRAVLDLVRQVRERFPEKDIWCYTGYLFEDLAAGKVGEHGRALLEQLDVLVDGPFVIGLKNLGLRFRGSSNQRIIEVRPSLERGEPVLWDETSVE